ncbi:MAG: MBOAT family protein, partial [Oscillospiraceae bacterium]|nr:MBOAT family protein [Oscillospiraceae bacterium]
MSISSVRYLLFLAAVTAAYFLLPKNRRALFLLLASYVFYALWRPAFCLLLLSGTAVSWACALAWEDRRLGRGTLWLALGALWLFGVLFVYKYLDFFVNTALRLAGRPADFSGGLLLPVGISFYTFSAASYLFDLGRGKLRAERSFARYALFVAFFPSILSGPINRAGRLLPQIREPEDFSWLRMKRGLLRFAAGAVKKLVLADTLAILVNGVYAAPESASRPALALAMLAYSLQIYFDFAGYTDMALGSAQILGYALDENFRAPYLTRSVRDFWRRWHISLTSWLRDYVYFPLGGSRYGARRAALNVLAVFAVSGLWHGADGSFIVWGLLNGAFQVLGEALTPLR